MPDEEVKIDIKAKYDSTGLNKAKQDLRQLPKAMDGTPAAMVQTEEGVKGITRATDALTPSAERAAAALKKVKAPKASVQTTGEWKGLLKFLLTEGEQNASAFLPVRVNSRMGCKASAEPLAGFLFSKEKEVKPWGKIFVYRVMDRPMGDEIISAFCLEVVF